MNHVLDVLIPTFNNPEYLQPCLMSLLRNRPSENLFHIYVINNGHPNSCDYITDPHITVINAEANLRWEGGINLGLKHSTAPYVCFLNDDTHIPVASRYWVSSLLQHFRDPSVAAVGPSSNVVMGFQNIFADLPFQVYTAKFLIGFCVIHKREYLDEIGHLDESLPGGDDFDWSIRYRKAGYKLVGDRNAFVYHHGFKTGIRVLGDHTTPGGWNSHEYTEKVDLALIRKHGFKEWWETRSGAYTTPEIIQTEKWEDAEGKMVKEYIIGDQVLDLGCGNNKTTETAIGVDMIAKDQIVETLGTNEKSEADVNADISEPLPFPDNSVDTIIARHILEHLIDPIAVLKNWKDKLRPGGRIIIAVPNEGLVKSIPMNIEHVHSWNPPAMASLLKSVGFKPIDFLNPENGVSFVSIAEK